MKKKFFGWTNLKWLIKEFLSMYSNKPSFFSKKRFESGCLFYTAEAGIIYYLKLHIITMSVGEIVAITTLLLTAAGYQLREIQKEKQLLSQETTKNNDTEEIENKV